MEITVKTRLQIGQILQNRGVVTAEEIEEVLAGQKDGKHRKLLGELLVENKLCTENQIASALSEAYDVPYAQLTPRICDPKIIEILPRDSRSIRVFGSSVMLLFPSDRLLRDCILPMDFGSSVMLL